MDETVGQLLSLLQLAERLKFELRHSWSSNGRRESVAEHSWQMALMAVLMHRHLEHPVNLEKALKMVVIHDLLEAEAGDIPFFETGPRKAAKASKEQAAIKNIRDMLDEPTGQEIYALWHEFEALQSLEAKFAKALDSLEVQIQHNLAPFDTWEEVAYGLVYSKMDKHCTHDAFLQAMCNGVKQAGEQKMIDAGVDVASVRAEAAAA